MMNPRAMLVAGANLYIQVERARLQWETLTIGALAHESFHFKHTHWQQWRVHTGTHASLH